VPGAAGKASAISKINWENEMNRLQKKSKWMRSLKMTVLLGLAALGGTAQLALGQETVQGEFKLSVEAQLGKTVLSAGEYKFSVQPLGIIRSVGSIHVGKTPVLVVVRAMTKGGPVASVMAMASSPDTVNPKALDIRQEGTAMMIRSMCLEKLGLVLQFNENRTKNAMLARGQELPQGGTLVKGSD
jgi:hypothetical protein